MDTMQHMTGTQAHKAIRNLVNNEYGITKEYAQQLIEEKISSVTQEYLRELNTNLLERTIKKVVLDFIEHGVKVDRYHTSSFVDYVQGVVKQTIQDEVIKNFAVNIERK
mgnify:CR=1 FL=1